MNDYDTSDFHYLRVQVLLGIYSKQSIFSLFPGLAFVRNSDNTKNVNAAVTLTDVRPRSDWGCRFFLREGHPLYLQQKFKKNSSTRIILASEMPSKSYLS